MSANNRLTNIMTDIKGKTRNKSLKLVFICSGNIIRSVFAEFLAKKYFISKDKAIVFESAGCFYQNSKISSLAKNWLHKEGISIQEINSHNPRLLSNYMDDFSKTDLFIGMTSEHIDYLNNYNIDIPAFLIKDLVLNKREDVLDPYFEPNQEENIMLELKDLISRFCELLENIL